MISKIQISENHLQQEFGRKYSFPMRNHFSMSQISTPSYMTKSHHFENSNSASNRYVMKNSMFQPVLPKQQFLNNKNRPLNNNMLSLYTQKNHPSLNNCSSSRMMFSEQLPYEYGGRVSYNSHFNPSNYQNCHNNRLNQSQVSNELKKSHSLTLNSRVSLMSFSNKPAIKLITNNNSVHNNSTVTDTVSLKNSQVFDMSLNLPTFQKIQQNVSENNKSNLFIQKVKSEGKINFNYIQTPFNERKTSKLNQNHNYLFTPRNTNTNTEINIPENDQRVSNGFTYHNQYGTLGPSTKHKLFKQREVLKVNRISPKITIMPKKSQSRSLSSKVKFNYINNPLKINTQPKDIHKNPILNKISKHTNKSKDKKLKILHNKNEGKEVFVKQYREDITNEYFPEFKTKMKKKKLNTNKQLNSNNIHLQCQNQNKSKKSSSKYFKDCDNDSLKSYQSNKNKTFIQGLEGFSQISNPQKSSIIKENSTKVNSINSSSNPHIPYIGKSRKKASMEETFANIKLVEKKQQFSSFDNFRNLQKDEKLSNSNQLPSNQFQLSTNSVEGAYKKQNQSEMQTGEDEQLIKKIKQQLNLNFGYSR